MKSETPNPKSESGEKCSVASRLLTPPFKSRVRPRLQPLRFPLGLRVSRLFRPSAFGLRTLPLLALLLAGCAVGPNYHRPAALGTNAMPASFFGAAATNLGDWKLAQPSAHLPRGSWWELFGDPELNRLEALATTNNQQLARRVCELPAGPRPGRRRPRGLLSAALGRSGLSPASASAPTSRRGAAASSNGCTFNTFTSRSTPVGNSTSGAGCAARSRAPAPA